EVRVEVLVEDELDEVAVVDLAAAVLEDDQDHDHRQGQERQPDPAAGHGRTGSAACLGVWRRRRSWGHRYSSVDGRYTVPGGRPGGRRGGTRGAGNRPLGVAPHALPCWG